MQQILDFLAALRDNNNRPWFLAHREEFLSVQERFNAFALRLAQAISAYDSTVAGLTLRDMTYRIYRDVRFSRDKSPYKTHMGVYVCRGGKKSGYSGYYLHLSPSGEDTFGLEGCCLAAGDYCCQGRVLRTLREDILYDPEAFRVLLEGAKGFRLDEQHRLARVPRGFDAAQPGADLLRYRVYCLTAPLPEEFLSSPRPEEVAAKAFRPAKPFLDFINRAIDYVREEEAERSRATR